MFNNAKTTQYWILTLLSTSSLYSQTHRCAIMDASEIQEAPTPTLQDEVIQIAVYSNSIEGEAPVQEAMNIPGFMKNRSKVLNGLFGDVDDVEGMVVPLEVSREYVELIVAFYETHHTAFPSEAADELWNEKEAAEWDKTADKQIKTKAEKCRFGTLAQPKKQHTAFFADMKSKPINDINSIANKFDMPALLLAGATILAMRVQGKTQAQVREEFELPPKTEEELAADREAVIARHPWLVGKKAESAIVTDDAMEEDESAAADE